MPSSFFHPWFSETSDRILSVADSLHWTTVAIDPRNEVRGATSFRFYPHFSETISNEFTQSDSRSNCSGYPRSGVDTRIDCTRFNEFNVVFDPHYEGCPSKHPENQQQWHPAVRYCGCNYGCLFGLKWSD